MCGIFGILLDRNVEIPPRQVRDTLIALLRYSENRGQEAAGIAFWDGATLAIEKAPLPGRKFVKTRAFERFLERSLATPSDRPRVFFGHARLDTNGSKQDEANNSPLRCGSVTGIHNGIVVNVDELWQRFGPELRTRTVDSELLFTMLDRYTQQGGDYPAALSRIFGDLVGSASIAALCERDRRFALATNTGSLFLSRIPAGGFVFASERYILNQVLDRCGLRQRPEEMPLTQVKPGTCCTIDLDDFALRCEAMTRPA